MTWAASRRTPFPLAVAILFRDADILDFFGAIDVARILSVTTRERFAPDLPHAVDVIRRHMLEMPGRLVSDAAKREGQRRVVEMQRFLDALGGETDSLRVLSCGRLPLASDGALPIGPRRDPELGAERPVEVGDVVEARLEGEVDDPGVLPRQSRGRFSQAGAHDELVRRHPGH
jgi:hypothetical protein